MIPSSTIQVKTFNSELNYNVEHRGKAWSEIKIHFSMLEVSFHSCMFFQNSSQNDMENNKENKNLNFSKLGDIFNHFTHTVSWQRQWNIANGLAEWEEVKSKKKAWKSFLRLQVPYKSIEMMRRIILELKTETDWTKNEHQLD